MSITGGADFKFSLDLNNQGLPGELPSGDEAVVYVEYDSETAGYHTSTLQILSDDNDEGEIIVDLSGQMTAPRVCVDLLDIDFGIVQINESRIVSFMLVNCGTADMNLFDVSLDPTSSSYYSLIGLPSFPATLPPDTLIDVHVQYSPQTEDAHVGAVDIFSDDPLSDPVTNYSGSVDLQGTGSDQICAIRPIQGYIDFGSVSPGGYEVKLLILMNDGSVSCTLQDVLISQNTADNEFSLLTEVTSGDEIGPGIGYGVYLQYSPVDDIGVDTAELSVLSNDPNGEVIFPLYGIGVEKNECDLLVTPMGLDFDSVNIGSSATLNILLQNLGMVDCNLSNIEIRPPMTGPSDFSIQNPPSLPLVIGRSGQPDSTYSLEIVFEPLEVGSHIASLRITSDDPDLEQIPIGEGRMLCMIPPVVTGQACVSLRGISEQ
jgi:hypothetical protein